MAYDSDFFKAYAEYLEEYSVRESHSTAFKWFRNLSWPDRLEVVDLGCGLGEFWKYGSWSKYVGIDLEPRGANTIQGDYRKINLNTDLPFKPNTFISLFSIEPCNYPEERYEIYRNLFDKNPSIQYGLSAGFYYADRIEQEQVTESGDIVSHQSIQPLALYSAGGLFTEQWLTLRTPSKMFGSDVVEVWKAFRRRD
jgi:hypothetical protein